MKTRTLAMVSAAIEAATGVTLIAAPDLVARVLLGSGLSDSGVAVARVGGFGLLALGISCWPSGDDSTSHATRALFVYNLLAGLYLGYLRLGGGFVSPVLWLASGLHVALAILFAKPALQ